MALAALGNSVEVCPNRRSFAHRVTDVRKYSGNSGHFAGHHSDEVRHPTATLSLKLFNDNRVRYIVIGGYALVQYIEPRYTKDLDCAILEFHLFKLGFAVAREVIFSAPLL